MVKFRFPLNKLSDIGLFLIVESPHSTYDRSFSQRFSEIKQNKAIGPLVEQMNSNNQTILGFAKFRIF